jgi:hypothetical protein
MTQSRRVIEAVVLPVGWGFVCGLALGVSAPLYIVGTVAGILGGIGGGAQHREVSQALLRGLVGGTLFGLGILLGFEVGGAEEAEVHLPDPAILLLLFTVLPAFPLHWFGWRLRQRGKLA